MSDFRKELDAFYFTFGIKKRIDCTRSENKKFAKYIEKGEELPPEICEYKNDGAHTYLFYRVSDPQATENDILDYIAFKQLEYTRTIKNCAVFFVLLVCIGFLLNFLILPSINR